MEIRFYRKRYSQKMYLFFIYGIFISILLGIFFCFTYSHYRSNIMTEAKQDSENLCTSVTNAVETQLDNLSTISMNIVYSNAIKTNFKEFSNLYQKTGNDPSALVASREKANAIHEIVTAIIGAYQSASEIKLYTMDGSCVETGYGLRMSTIELDALPWYKEVMKLNGYKYFSLPTENPKLPDSNGKNGNSRFLSLIRLFLDSSGQPEGIVEVVQDCDKIFALASQLENANPDSRVFIYNAEHELVYPYTGKKPDDFYNEIEKNHLQETTAQIIETESQDSLLLTYENIPDYNWTIIVTRPQSTVYQTLNNFRRIFFVIGSASLLLTLIICFYISQRLTTPLQKLTNAASKITINRVLSENKVNLTSADSNIKELATLCESIRTMYEKLRSTSQEALLSKSEETRAKLQATQSLINPHFLYNSLTNISVMAEEEMNDDVVQLCAALCDYFRYISSGQEMIVTLEQEIFYTRRYLDCMKLRFGEELEYSIEIAEESSQFFIPKLILQPIVENTFKYAFHISPPWKLKITSHVQNQYWILKVEDNGGNLSDEKKQELLNLYKNLDMKEELKSMQIGGMGLKNVYLRLKLLYGEHAVFQIENSYPRRTIFILGGPIYHSREEYYDEHPQL